MQAKIAAVDLVETLRLVLLAGEDLDHTLPLQGLSRRSSDVSHRALNARAVAAKGATHCAEQPGQKRPDDREHERQFDTEIQHDADHGHDEHQIAHYDDDRVGQAFGNLFRVERQARDQVARGMTIEKRGGQI